MTTECRPKVPDGLRELVKDLTREILKNKPSDIYEFSENYFKFHVHEKANYNVKEFEPMTKIYDFSYMHQNRQRHHIPIEFVHSVIPECLTAMIKDFMKAVLKEQPSNLWVFAMDYFRFLRQEPQMPKDISYATYEIYTQKNECLVFTPFVKCTCGRTYGQGFDAGYNVKHITGTNVYPSFYPSNNLHDSNCVATGASSNSQSANNVIKYSKEYINSIYVIQRYYRRYLRNKRSSQAQKKGMSDEMAAIIIQRNLRKLFSKTKSYDIEEINTDLSTAQSNQQENDNISEAASYTSASTAIMTASESSRDFPEISAAEKMVTETIIEHEELDNDQENNINMQSFQYPDLYSTDLVENASLSHLSRTDTITDDKQLYEELDKDSTIGITEPNELHSTFKSLSQSSVNDVKVKDGEHLKNITTNSLETQIINKIFNDNLNKNSATKAIEEHSPLPSDLSTLTDTRDQTINIDTNIDEDNDQNIEQVKHAEGTGNETNEELNNIEEIERDSSESKIVSTNAEFETALSVAVDEMAPAENVITEPIKQMSDSLSKSGDTLKSIEKNPQSNEIENSVDVSMEGSDKTLSHIIPDRDDVTETIALDKNVLVEETNGNKNKLEGECLENKADQEETKTSNDIVDITDAQAVDIINNEKRKSTDENENNLNPIDLNLKTVEENKKAINVDSQLEHTENPKNEKLVERNRNEDILKETMQGVDTSNQGTSEIKTDNTINEANSGLQANDTNDMLIEKSLAEVKEGDSLENIKDQKQTNDIIEVVEQTGEQAGDIINSEKRKSTDENDNNLTPVDLTLKTVEENKKIITVDAQQHECTENTENDKNVERNLTENALNESNQEDGSSIQGRNEINTDKAVNEIISAFKAGANNDVLDEIETKKTINETNSQLQSNDNKDVLDEKESDKTVNDIIAVLQANDNKDVLDAESLADLKIQQRSAKNKVDNPTTDLKNDTIKGSEKTESTDDDNKSVALDLDPTTMEEDVKNKIGNNSQHSKDKTSAKNQDLQNDNNKNPEIAESTDDDNKSVALDLDPTTIEEDVKNKMENNLQHSEDKTSTKDQDLQNDNDKNTGIAESTDDDNKTMEEDVKNKMKNYLQHSEDKTSTKNQDLQNDNNKNTDIAESTDDDNIGIALDLNPTTTEKDVKNEMENNLQHSEDKTSTKNQDFQKNELEILSSNEEKLTGQNKASVQKSDEMETGIKSQDNNSMDKESLEDAKDHDRTENDIRIIVSDSETGDIKSTDKTVNDFTPIDENLKTFQDIKNASDTDSQQSKHKAGDESLDSKESLVETLPSTDVKELGQNEAKDSIESNKIDISPQVVHSDKTLDDADKKDSTNKDLDAENSNSGIDPLNQNEASGAMIEVKSRIKREIANEGEKPPIVPEGNELTSAENIVKIDPVINEVKNALVTGLQIQTTGEDAIPIVNIPTNTFDEDGKESKIDSTPAKSDEMTLSKTNSKEIEIESTNSEIGSANAVIQHPQSGEKNNASAEIVPANSNETVAETISLNEEVSAPIKTLDKVLIITHQSEIDAGDCNDIINSNSQVIDDMKIAKIGSLQLPQSKEEVREVIAKMDNKEIMPESIQDENKVDTTTDKSDENELPSKPITNLDHKEMNIKEDVANDTAYAMQNIEDSTPNQNLKETHETINEISVVDPQTHEVKKEDIVSIDLQTEKEFKNIKDDVLLDGEKICDVVSKATDESKDVVVDDSDKNKGNGDELKNDNGDIEKPKSPLTKLQTLTKENEPIDVASEQSTVMGNRPEVITSVHDKNETNGTKSEETNIDKSFTQLSQTDIDPNEINETSISTTEPILPAEPESTNSHSTANEDPNFTGIISQPSKIIQILEQLGEARSQEVIKGELQSIVIKENEENADTKLPYHQDDFNTIQNETAENKVPQLSEKDIHPGEHAVTDSINIASTNLEDNHSMTDTKDTTLGNENDIARNIGNKSTNSNIGKQNLSIGRIKHNNEGLLERFSDQLFAETHLASFWKENQMNKGIPVGPNMGDDHFHMAENHLDKSTIRNDQEPAANDVNDIRKSEDIQASEMMNLVDEKNLISGGHNTGDVSIANVEDTTVHGETAGNDMRESEDIHTSEMLKVVDEKNLTSGSHNLDDYVNIANENEENSAVHGHDVSRELIDSANISNENAENTTGNPSSENAVDKEHGLGNSIEPSQIILFSENLIDGNTESNDLHFTPHRPTEEERMPRYFHGIAPKETLLPKRKMYKEPTSFVIPMDDVKKSSIKKSVPGNEADTKNELEYLASEPMLEIESPTKLFAELSVFETQADDFQLNITHAMDDITPLNSENNFNENTEQQEELEENNAFSRTSETGLHTIFEMSEPETPRTEEPTVLSKLETDTLLMFNENGNNLDATLSWKNDIAYKTGAFLESIINEENYLRKYRADNKTNVSNLVESETTTTDENPHLEEVAQIMPTPQGELFKEIEKDGDVEEAIVNEEKYLRKHLDDNNANVSKQVDSESTSSNENTHLEEAAQKMPTSKGELFKNIKKDSDVDEAIEEKHFRKHLDDNSTNVSKLVDSESTSPNENPQPEEAALIMPISQRELSKQIETDADIESKNVNIIKSVSTIQKAFRMYRNKKLSKFNEDTLKIHGTPEKVVAAAVIQTAFRHFMKRRSEFVTSKNAIKKSDKFSMNNNGQQNAAEVIQRAFKTYLQRKTQQQKSNKFEPEIVSENSELIKVSQPNSVERANSGKMMEKFEKMPTLPQDLSEMDIDSAIEEGVKHNAAETSEQQEEFNSTKSNIDQTSTDNSDSNLEWTEDHAARLIQNSFKLFMLKEYPALKLIEQTTHDEDSTESEPICVKKILESLSSTELNKQADADYISDREKNFPVPNEYENAAIIQRAFRAYLQRSRQRHNSGSMSLQQDESNDAKHVDKVTENHAASIIQRFFKLWNIKHKPIALNYTNLGNVEDGFAETPLVIQKSHSEAQIENEIATQKHQDLGNSNDAQEEFKSVQAINPDNLNEFEATAPMLEFLSDSSFDDFKQNLENRNKSETAGEQNHAATIIQHFLKRVLKKNSTTSTVDLENSNRSEVNSDVQYNDRAEEKNHAATIIQQFFKRALKKISTTSTIDLENSDTSEVNGENTQLAKVEEQAFNQHLKVDAENRFENAAIAIQKAFKNYRLRQGSHKIKENDQAESVNKSAHVDSEALNSLISREDLAAKIIQRAFKEYIAIKRDQNSLKRCQSTVVPLEEPDIDLSESDVIINDFVYKAKPNWYVGNEPIVTSSSPKIISSEISFEETDASVDLVEISPRKSTAQIYNHYDSDQFSNIDTRTYNSEGTLAEVRTEDADTQLIGKSMDATAIQPENLNTGIPDSQEFADIEKDILVDYKIFTSNFIESERIYSYQVNQLFLNPNHQEYSVPYEKLTETLRPSSVSFDEMLSKNAANDNSSASGSDHDSSLEITDNLLDKSEVIIEKMQQRKDSTSKISYKDVSRESRFDDSLVLPINSVETDDDGIIVTKLQRDDTRESSALSDEIVCGNTNDVSGSFNRKSSGNESTEEPFKRIASNLENINVPKSVTIDESIRYIEPSDYDFFMDTDTSENIRRKMLAYSFSEADSDYSDKKLKKVDNSSSDMTSQFFDDFNVSTALVHYGDTSTDTESTIVSAVTKIQAGARGYLTRKRLYRTSAASEGIDQSKASFGNAAISESLEYLLQETAARRIQKFYRNHINKAHTKINNSYKNSVVPYSTTSVESSLAQKRSMLQRGDALLNDSIPDDGNAISRDDKVVNELQTKQLGDTMERNTSIGKKTRSNVRITEKKEMKWLAMRQNSMPVQIDCEVFRVIPKHMRKKIKSADGTRNKKRSKVLND